MDTVFSELKKAGYPLKSEVIIIKGRKKTVEFAPTKAELIMACGNHSVKDVGNGFVAFIGDEGQPDFKSDVQPTEYDALAKLWVACHKTSDSVKLDNKSK